MKQQGPLENFIPNLNPSTPCLLSPRHKFTRLKSTLKETEILTENKLRIFHNGKVYYASNFQYMLYRFRFFLAKSITTISNVFFLQIIIKRKNSVQNSILLSLSSSTHP